eukprot:6396809-Alexandrium_andersonii.AAC.1
MSGKKDLLPCDGPRGAITNLACHVPTLQRKVCQSLPSRCARQQLFGVAARNAKGLLPKMQ